MSNVHDDFKAQDLQLRSYTTTKIFSTTKKVKPIGKKKFATATYDLDHGALIIHIVVPIISSEKKVHLSQRAQIAYLKANEAPTKVLNKYVDFLDVFSTKLAIELSIKLVDN